MNHGNKVRVPWWVVYLLMAAISTFLASCAGGPAALPSPDPNQQSGTETVVDGEIGDNVVVLQMSTLLNRFETMQRVDAYIDGATSPQGTLMRGQGDFLSIPVSPGTHQITLKLYDGTSQLISTGSDIATVGDEGTTSIHIRLAEVVPVITAMQPTGLVPVGTSATVTATVAARDGVPYCRVWLDGNQVDGVQKTLSPSFPVGSPSAGSHTLRLQATGTSGGVAEVVWSFTITGGGGNLPPIASFTASPSSGTAPLTVNFNASGSSDPDGNIVSYAWIHGDGATGSGVTPSHVYTVAGTYTAVLTVTDNGGLTATASKTITVTGGGSNQPPVASFTASPSSGTAPLAVSFDGSASYDPDGSIVSHSWNFGDGGTGSGMTPSHTYTAAGTYTAMLTVTDNQGATASTSRTITVTGGGGGGANPPWDEWVGRTNVFWKEIGSLVYQKATQLICPTLPGSTTCDFSLFDFSSDDNIELLGRLNLQDGGMAGGEIAHTVNGVRLTYPGAVWSSDPWVYNNLGDGNPGTGTLTISNVRIDLNGDGSPEYMGTIVIRQVPPT